uniref:Crp/Fnr family transcriptional regulator n=1 Tax=candidate division WOR-3 bacterium TaxID=2052148 RepID=A0A7C4UBR4_UNCW3
MDEKTFGNLKVLKQGEILFREGDPGEEMFLIKKGEIKITKKIGDEDKVLAILKEGDFFGEMAIIDKAPRSATAIASTDTELIVVDREAFLKQVKENPFIEYVLETLTRRLRTTDEMLKFLYIQNEEKRFVLFLLNKAKTQGNTTEEGVDSRIESKPEAISQVIGVDKEKVTNFMGNLVKRNLIVLRNNIIIRDLNLLEKYVEYLELKEKFER